MLKAGHMGSPPGMVVEVQFLVWPLPLPFAALADLDCAVFVRSINDARFFSLACFVGGVHPSWESIAFM